MPLTFTSASQDNHRRCSGSRRPCRPKAIITGIELKMPMNRTSGSSRKARFVCQGHDRASSPELGKDRPGLLTSLHNMAKGQLRSNREKKKPKQDKKKVPPPATPIGSTDQRGKPGQGGAPKKG